MSAHVVMQFEIMTLALGVNIRPRARPTRRAQIAFGGHRPSTATEVQAPIRLMAHRALVISAE